ncbi:MAG: hypothetical protein RBR86_03985 [Pseudobdellovibrionaceae bacterium]|jgi:2-beta-glucuronyltransferase|nr:hypothetical protein [Pseudobdellovibrionaceae bacterium]
MSRYLFICGHDPDAERKVDLHFLARHLVEDKHSVSFIIVGSSLIGYLLGKSSIPPEANQWSKPGHFSKYFWYPLFHPMKVSHPLLRHIFKWLCRFYANFLPSSAFPPHTEYDEIMVESGAGLALIPLLKARYPRTRFIYSVSDRLARLNVPESVYNYESEALDCFDLIRVPSPLMMNDFGDRRTVRFIPHGIDCALFDTVFPSPYITPKNAISIGVSLFDAEAIQTLALAYPDWSFHLFGDQAKLDKKIPNVIEHGETRFEDIIPFIQHADVGLALYCDAPLADYISHSSLRMIQYSYCRLPIVTAHFSARDRAHAFGYEIGNLQELRNAFDQAKMFDRSTITRDNISDWKDIADTIFTDSH